MVLLPINYTAAALIFIGVGLMIAEVHIGAFGAFGLGGIVAFVIGALMVFPSVVPALALPETVVTVVAIVGAMLLLIALVALLHSRKRPLVTGGEALIGATGETLSWQGDEGRIRVEGEIWRARADTPLPSGSRVKVVGRDGLVLVVEPARAAA
jgi:membrane-bound serine protease (ClpP class)